MSSKMELSSTNNLLEEELIIHNNLTGNDFDLDNNKGKYRSRAIKSRGT